MKALGICGPKGSGVLRSPAFTNRTGGGLRMEKLLTILQWLGHLPEGPGTPEIVNGVLRIECVNKRESHRAFKRLWEVAKSHPPAFPIQVWCVETGREWDTLGTASQR